jgi:hypothetical protein
MQIHTTDSNDIDFSEFLGKIILCRKGTGKEFVSLLYAIQGDELVFKTRNGKFISNPAASINYATEV